MKYYSTRHQDDNGSESPTSGLQFQDVLFAGYLQDGGLAVPERIPTITHDILASWSSLGYVQLAEQIIPMFIGEDEISRTDLQQLIHGSFDKFDVDDVVRLVPLKDGSRVSGHVLEMFHGPSLSFKDLTLSVAGRLYEYFLTKHRSRCVVIVVTSGDTGSAVIEAVKDRQSIDAIVVLPRDRCTKLQELQMTTVLADNIHVIRGDGTSDELDEPVRQCFTDTQFIRKYRLCSFNSINWIRILVQSIHYFYAYLKVRPACDGLVEIVVPTGSCGNIAAGCVARKMGLPIRIVAADNANDVVSRLLETGSFSVNVPVVPSLACAMDTQMAYNVERLLWIFSDGDSRQVRHLMETFERNSSSVTLPPDLHHKILETVIPGHKVSDDEIRSTIQRCSRENDKYLVCPHTATALCYHYRQLDLQRRNLSSSPANSIGNPEVTPIPRVCLATASPAKFPEVMTSCGLQPATSGRLESLSTLPTRYRDMERTADWLSTIRQLIEDIANG